MTTGAESPFHRALSRPSNRKWLGASALLAWVAASDGKITPSEHKLLRDFAGSRQRPSDLDLALKVARDLDLDDLMLACDAVRTLPPEARRMFVRWAISVATSDSKLASTTNYILRFLADLTEIDLGDACRQAKRSLPLPGDPSSIDWRCRDRMHGRAE